MVFSIKSEIRGFYLDSQVYYPVTTNLQHAVAVSQDANYVYWSDVKNGDEAIIKSFDDGSHQEVIVTTGKSYDYFTFYQRRIAKLLIANIAKNISMFKV